MKWQKISSLEILRLIDRKAGYKLATSRGRYQLKIVVVIDLSFTDVENSKLLGQDTNPLKSHQDLVRRHFQLNNTRPVEYFESFIIAEFGSVSLAFDRITQIRTVLQANERETNNKPKYKLTYPRFSCHLGEIRAGNSLLESTIVRKAIDLIGFIQSDEIIVSRAVFDMLPKQQEYFVEYDQDSFVMRSHTHLKKIKARGSDASLESAPLNNSSPANGMPKVTYDRTHAERKTQNKADVGIEDATIVGANFLQVNSATKADVMSEDVTIVGPVIKPNNPIVTATLSSAKAVAAGEEAIFSQDNPSCYRALADIHTLIERGEHTQDTALNTCRTNIEAALNFSGAAVYFLNNRPHIFRAENAIEIGRRRLTHLEDIHVGCRLVSKFGGQTKIEYKDNEFQVTDQESTNGTFLNQSQITPGNWEHIQNGATIHTGGGLKPPKPGLCVLACNRITGDYPALVMEFKTSQMGPDDIEKISPHWSTMHLDSEYRWVLAPNGILIGNSPECIITAPHDEGNSAAKITFNNGYSIKPEIGSKLTVSGVPFTTEVPLAKESEININGTTFQFYSSRCFYKSYPIGSGND